MTKKLLALIGWRKKNKTAHQRFHAWLCHVGCGALEYGLLYGVGLGVAFALYAASMHWFFSQQHDILFYRGIILMLVDAVILFCALHALCAVALPRARAKTWRKHYLTFVKTQIVGVTLAGLFFNMAFHGTVTTSLDRAISVFLLGHTYKVNKPVGLDDWKKQFADVYVKKYGAIERRVGEQLASGNVKKTANGKMVLTPKGEKTVASWLVFNRILNVNNRFVSPDLVGK